MTEKTDGKLFFPGEEWRNEIKKKALTKSTMRCPSISRRNEKKFSASCSEN